MIRICSECKLYMGEKEPLEDTSLTHGYCSSCFEALIGAVENSKLVEGV